MSVDVLNYSPRTIDPVTMIQVYQKELGRAEQEVSQYKKLIAMLKKSNKHGVFNQITDFDLKVANLKWRKEIRECLNLPQKFVSTSGEIAACVVIRNDLPAIDRNIKTKISTTLSILHAEKEIGRYVSIGGEFMYGRKEYFEDDLKTLKQEYQKHIQ